MNGGNWLRLDEKGYMTNWFTDTNGHKFYLNSVSDGTRGALLINTTTQTNMS